MESYGGDASCSSLCRVIAYPALCYGLCLYCLRKLINRNINILFFEECYQSVFILDRLDLVL